VLRWLRWLLSKAAKLFATYDMMSAVACACLKPMHGPSYLRTSKMSRVAACSNLQAASWAAQHVMLRRGIDPGFNVCAVHHTTAHANIASASPASLNLPCAVFEQPLDT
jgi:hypothetical protein